MNSLLAASKLQNHPFMADAPEAFLNKLAAFQRDISFKPGDILFREREYAHKFYLILEGEIRIESFVANTSPPLAIQTIRAGEILGWSWLYPPFVWHFTARALSDGSALVFDAPTLMIMAEEDPAFGCELMKRLSIHVVRRLETTIELLLASNK